MTFRAFSALAAALLTATPVVLAAQDAPLLAPCVDSVARLRHRDQGDDSAKVTARRQAVRSLAQSCMKMVAAKNPAPASLDQVALLQASAGDYGASLATLRRWAAATQSAPELTRAIGFERILPPGAVALADPAEPGLLDAAHAIVQLADSMRVKRAGVNTRFALALLERNTANKAQSYAVVREMLTGIAHNGDSAYVARRLGSVKLLLAVTKRWGEEDNHPELAASVRDAAKALFGAWPGFAVLVGDQPLVGSQAAPIVAEQWLNAPAGTTRLAFEPGQVYLVEFTAHWCGPCRASYDSLRDLVAANPGVKLLFSTALYGYFGGVENVAPAAELDSLRALFARERISAPVAVSGELSAPPGTNQAIRNASGATYNADMLPTVVLIDRKGVVRKTWAGWGDDIQKDVAQTVAAVAKE